MRNSRNAILKRQTADGESRTQGGNRRLRKMNGVGWLQKSAVCGKIDSYGASRGHFRCKSGRECHAGERFHVLVSQRMSTVSHAMRSLHRTPTVSRATHVLFTSNGDDFARRASFYIARRRFRVLRVCFLHRTAVISHTAHAFASSPMISHVMRSFTSPGGDFVRHVFTSHAELSHFAHSFTLLGDDFAHCARFYIARR